MKLDYVLPQISLMFMNVATVKLDNSDEPDFRLPKGSFSWLLDMYFISIYFSIFRFAFYWN